MIIIIDVYFPCIRFHYKKNLTDFAGVYVDIYRSEYSVVNEKHICDLY